MKILNVLTSKGATIMVNTRNFNVRVDCDILKQCEAMYGELGVDLNTAINVFLNKSLCVGGFPFDVNK